VAYKERIMTRPASPPHISAKLPTHLLSHTFHGLALGPRLVVLGAVHGNEVCGALAIGELLTDIDTDKLVIERGTLTFVPVTNPLAWQLKQRTGDRNLNRNMAPSASPQDFEDRIANVLCPILEAHDVLLDLHSFHTGGAPFVMIGPQNNNGELEPFAHAEQEMQLALHTGPFRILEGWLDTYARGLKRRNTAAAIPGLDRSQALVTDTNYGVGTTEYMRSRGGYGVTLECGQHEDPNAVTVAKNAIEQTLALLGMTDKLPQLPASDREILRLVEVTDRDHAGDTFTREWCSFDAVKAGDLIGTRHTGTEVKAQTNGFIVFPNPGGQVGQEWFYFAQRRV
jgi:predicted deacylase